MSLSKKRYRGICSISISKSGRGMGAQMFDSAFFHLGADVLGDKCLRFEADQMIISSKTTIEL